MGICYGWQLTAKLLGGDVRQGNGEYKPTAVLIARKSLLFDHISDQLLTVLMSHGDQVIRAPVGFECVASTPDVPLAVVAGTKRERSIPMLSKAKEPRMRQLLKAIIMLAGSPKGCIWRFLNSLWEYYKDQVRELGRQLDLPDEVISKQLFPGLGAAIRIMGEVTKDRLDRYHQADRIVMGVLTQEGWYEKVF